MKCPMCGKDNCSCMKYMWILGVIFLILAWMLWANRLSLEQTVAILLVIMGIKKIVISFHKK